MALKVTFVVLNFFIYNPVPREAQHEFTDSASSGPSVVAELLVHIS